MHKYCNIDDHAYVLVDTPGYRITGHRNDVYFNKMEQYLSGSGGVDTVIFVMNGSNFSFDVKSMEMLKHYREYFGPGLWNHMIIIPGIWY